MSQSFGSFFVLYLFFLTQLRKCALVEVKLREIPDILTTFERILIKVCAVKLCLCITNVLRLSTVFAKINENTNAKIPPPPQA